MPINKLFFILNTDGLSSPEMISLYCCDQRCIQVHILMSTSIFINASFMRAIFFFKKLDWLEILSDRALYSASEVNRHLGQIV